MKRRPVIFRVKKYLQSGFTLIELLVVMVIIGLLAALVVPKFFGHVDKAMQQDAQAQIELLGQALDLHRLENHKYPSTDEGLKQLLHILKKSFQRIHGETIMYTPLQGNMEIMTWFHTEPTAWKVVRISTEIL